MNTKYSSEWYWEDTEQTWYNFNDLMQTLYFV